MVKKTYKTETFSSNSFIHSYASQMWFSAIIKLYSFLILAYVHRDYNVVAIDWERVSAYPCYLSSLSNTRLVAQCTAQLYSFLTYMGTAADDIVCIGNYFLIIFKITWTMFVLFFLQIGHSLGAHICGMVSNHLTKKQYKIIGKRRVLGES